MPRRPRPPTPPPPPAGARRSSDLGYGSFKPLTGYLRQDTRPVPFVSVKLRRHVRLDGTRLSLAKAPTSEVIWGFDIGGATVETFAADRKVSIWLTDSMRKRRRVIVLVAERVDEFERWAFWLRRASEAVLERHYEMRSYINTGSFARVVRGRDLHTGGEVAIKLIEKSNSPPSARRYMAREVAIMRRVRHENIVRCLDVFDGVLRTRIVMELCPGVLQEVIDGLGGVAMEERAAREVLRGVLRGLRYLHGEGVVHRDVKPSNILLSSTTEPYGPVKLSDFGLSNYAADGGAVGGSDDGSDARGTGPVLSSAVGTLAFVAPDLLLGENYGAPVDLWSAGVVLYIMLAGGRLPFRGKTSADALAQLKRGAVDMTAIPDTRVSDSARHLLRALLNIDPAKRLTADQALGHPWMRVEAPAQLAPDRDPIAPSRGVSPADVPTAAPAGSASASPAAPAPSSAARGAADAEHAPARTRRGAHWPTSGVAGAAAPGRSVSPSSDQDWSAERRVGTAARARGHALLGL
jgi:calcium/calmodulin-dependent protein kinase I